MLPLKRIDILFFTYLSISTLLIFISWDSINNSLQLALIRIPIVLSVIGIIYLDSKKKQAFIYFLRQIYPVIFSGYFYSETVFYNKIIFNNLDSYLVDIEYWLFNMQASLEFAAYFSNKLFSELMYFSYFSFYLLILGFTLTIFFKKKVLFEKAIFQLSASLYIFYFIFSFIPSAGPQFYFSYPDNILPQAYFFDHIMHFIQRTAEQPTGAFPSSHVGISLIILLISRNIAPLFYKIFWPIVILILFSTVYIKAHYVIDVIGGIIIAPFILYLSNILYQILNKKNLYPYDKTERSKK